MMIDAVIHGFLFMAALITGMGPQNVHVMRTGLAGNRLGAVVLVCWLGDVGIILFGVLGVSAASTVLHISPSVLKGLTVAVLSFYAATSLHRALCPSIFEDGGLGNQRDAVRLAFLLTFLNPCVYADSFFVIGTQANLYDSLDRWGFALGAALVSGLWYFGIGYGARLLYSGSGTRLHTRSLDWGVASLMCASLGWLILH